METRVVVYRWAEVEKHLRERLEAARQRLERAETTDDLRIEQGRVRELREMLVLPETLTVLRGD